MHKWKKPQICKTVLLDCKEICVLSFQQNTLQSFLEGLGKTNSVAAPFRLLLCCPLLSQKRLTHLLLHPLVIP